MLEHWLYRSESVTPPRSVDDALIYLQACNRNPAHAITGYLHREQRHYAQYVEGPAVALRALHRQIVNDGRHHDVRTLAQGTASARRFAGWDMAFSTAEMVSFERFQRRHDRPEALHAASAADILAFMDDMARRHAETGLAPNMPHHGREGPARVLAAAGRP